VSKDKEALTFEEIERGLYFGFAGGINYIFNPPADSGPRPLTSGEMVELEVGTDIGSRLALSVFVRGSYQGVGGLYTGQSDQYTPPSGGTASSTNIAVGDFSTLVPGVSVRFKPFGIEDSQQVARTWFYLRGGAGYAMFFPKALLPNTDILVFAGPGIEYYTRLRHFSIGVEAVGTVLVKSGAVGFALTPNLRYAF
jgi:hypothetical protein